MSSKIFKLILTLCSQHCLCLNNSTERSPCLIIPRFSPIRPLSRTQKDLTTLHTQLQARPSHTGVDGVLLGAAAPQTQTSSVHPSHPQLDFYLTRKGLKKSKQHTKTTESDKMVKCLISFNFIWPFLDVMVQQKFCILFILALSWFKDITSNAHNDNNQE